MSVYRALDLLHKKHPPVWRGRAPYWRPPVDFMQKAAQDSVLMPAWSWIAPDVEPVGTLITLDANAAYLSAASSVLVAHSQLVNVQTPPSGGMYPGYYLINNHSWPDPQIPSPLGTAAPAYERIWVSHPTLSLLTQLEASGHWPQVRVYDAWIAKDCRAVRFRNWTNAVREDRNRVLDALEKDRGDQDAADRYEAIKTGYSVALQIMLSGVITMGDEEKKAPIHRPDWYHAVLAQHAATLWRKTWYALMAGFPPAGMGGVDEVVYREKDFFRLAKSPKAPLIIDETGKILGSFKTKVIRTYQEQTEMLQLFEDSECGHLGCAYGTCLLGDQDADEPDVDADW